jgi:hypothetical protein
MVSIKLQPAHCHEQWDAINKKRAKAKKNFAVEVLKEQCAESSSLCFLPKQSAVAHRMCTAGVAL